MKSLQYIAVFVFTSILMLGISNTAQAQTLYKVQVGAFKNPANKNTSNLVDVGNIYWEVNSAGVTRIVLGYYNSKSEAESVLQQVKAKGHDAIVGKSTTEMANNALLQSSAPSTSPQMGYNSNTNVPAPVQEEVPLPPAPAPAPAPNDFGTNNNSSIVTNPSIPPSYPTETTPPYAIEETPPPSVPTDNNTGSTYTPPPAKYGPEVLPSQEQYLVLLGTYPSMKAVPSLWEINDLGDFFIEESNQEYKVFIGSFNQRNTAEQVLQKVKRGSFTEAQIRKVMPKNNSPLNTIGISNAAPTYTPPVSTPTQTITYPQTEFQSKTNNGSAINYEPGPSITPESSTNSVLPNLKEGNSNNGVVFTPMPSSAETTAVPTAPTYTPPAPPTAPTYTPPVSAPSPATSTTSPNSNIQPSPAYIAFNQHFEDKRATFLVNAYDLIKNPGLTKKIPPGSIALDGNLLANDVVTFIEPEGTQVAHYAIAKYELDARYEGFIVREGPNAYRRGNDIFLHVFDKLTQQVISKRQISGQTNQGGQMSFTRSWIIDLNRDPSSVPDLLVHHLSSGYDANGNFTETDSFKAFMWIDGNFVEGNILNEQNIKKKLGME